jgi:flagellar biosynthesis GTPase FlhF
LIATVVFVAYIAAIICALGVIWTAIPAVAGVPSAFLPFMAFISIGMGSLWLAYTLTDYEQPAEVKALKASEDALRARRELAREKKEAQESRAAASQQLEARKQKLRDDLEWERIQNDPSAKAKFEADANAENAKKRQLVQDAENTRIAKGCDQEVQTWPERALPRRCTPPEVRQLMQVSVQQQATLAHDVGTRQQDQIDRADAQRCDTYFLRHPNGRAWPRCGAPEVYATAGACTAGRSE